MRMTGLIEVAILLLVMSTPANAFEFDEEWNWYYAGFSSPDLGASSYIRWGTARVHVHGQEIKIEFREPALPEGHGILLGKVAHDGHVNGKLEDLFPESTEEMIGKLRFTSAPCSAKNLVLEMKDFTGEEIVLKSPLCESRKSLP